MDHIRGCAGIDWCFERGRYVLPRSWIAKACKKDRDDARLFSAPLKLLGSFAALFYVLALVAYFAPHNWNLSSQLMLMVCPMYLVKMTIDPPPI